MEQDVLSILEKERKQVWRNFLFKKHWFLNLIIASCLIGILFQLIQLMFPSWFVEINDLGPTFGKDNEELYAQEVAQINQSAPIWIFIITFFTLSMFLVKWALYRVLFVTDRHQIEYYKNLQHQIISPLLEKYGEESFPLPFEKFKNSELTGPNTSIIIREHKNQKMYFGSNHFSKHSGDLLVQFGNVTCKGPFTSKGQEHIGLIFTGMVVILTQPNLPMGRLKIFHDRTGRLFGQVLQRKKLSEDSLIEFQDAAFEKKFKIYASDKDFANEILQTDFKILLMKWKSKFDKKLLITIIDGTIAISLPNWSSMLYPKIYKKLYIKDLETELKTFEEFLSEVENVFQTNNSVQGYAV